MKQLIRVLAFLCCVPWEFMGTTWFPIDIAYRVTATFTAYDQPEQRQVPYSRNFISPKLEMLYTNRMCNPSASGWSIASPDRYPHAA
jgi:hypothetical protein